MLIYFAVLSKNMGSDCTPSALDNRFRSIKKDAKAINSAVAKGIDVLTLHIGVDGPKCRLKLLFSSTLHTACFRIFKHITRYPAFASLNTFLYQDLPSWAAFLIVAEMAKYFMEGMKPHAMRMHFFRNINPSVKLVREAVDNGEDPFYMPLVSTDERKC